MRAHTHTHRHTQRHTHTDMRTPTHTQSTGYFAICGTQIMSKRIKALGKRTIGYERTSSDLKYIPVQAKYYHRRKPIMHTFQVTQFYKYGQVIFVKLTKSVG